MPLGVAGVHPGQVGSEQRRLLATLTGLDLEDDVVGVVRIARRELIGQLSVELCDGGLKLRHLRGERLVVGGQLPGRLEVTAGGFELAVSRDDRRDLGEPPADLAGGGGIGVQIRIGELALEVGMFGEHRLDHGCRVGHVVLLTAAASPPFFRQTQTDARAAQARSIGRRRDS